MVRSLLRSIVFVALGLSVGVFGDLRSVKAEDLAQGTGGNDGSGLTATVVRKNGLASVIFQPITADEPIDAYDKSGVLLGKMGWEALFEVQVTESTLREATSADGINIHKLLNNIGAVRNVDGKPMIRAEVPYSVKREDGSEVSSGDTVYFQLSSVLKDRMIEPVGAYASDEEPKAVESARAFNETLLKKGVQGSIASKKKKAVAHSHREVHPGEPNVPLLEPREQAPSSEARFLSPPTCGCTAGSCRQSSYFGKRRVMRTTNGKISSSFHPGLDIGGGLGTEIRASADGCVSKQISSRASSWGLSVFLDHGNGFTTQYSHMKGFAPGVAAGQCFKRGDVLGYVGETGNCTGPHLHFGVYRNGKNGNLGKAVDPRRYLLARSDSEFSMSCENLVAYNSSLSDMAPMLAQMAPALAGSDGLLASNARDDRGFSGVGVSEGRSRSAQAYSTRR